MFFFFRNEPYYGDNLKTDDIILTPTQINDNPAVDAQRRPATNVLHLLPEYPGLKNVLDQDIFGRALQGLYNIEGELDSLSQGYLCTLLVTYFLNKEPFL